MYELSTLKNRRSLVISLFMTLILAGYSSVAQQPDSLIREERKFFDQLIGKWKIESKETEAGVEVGGDDIYSFNSFFPGALESGWYFNRGTKDKPNYVNARCYLGYNNLTRNWSFYYVSEFSAQYFEGKANAGNWEFYRTFLMNGQEFIQKQYWLFKSSDQVERHILNSFDKGKTWNFNYKASFKKIK